MEDSLKTTVEDSLKTTLEESLKTSVEDRYQLKWSKEQTSKFIKLRAENAHLFTGVKHSAALAWGTILVKMGLQGKVTPMQAKKKWDNLKRKHKHCRSEETGDDVSKKPSAATWPWFNLMEEVLGGQGHVTSCPIVNGSEETPGPSSAVEGQREDDPAVPDRKRKRGREDIVELLELIKENMRCQREVEDRRARESRERMDTLFTLLEKLIEKNV
ncbi:uncharacterized protein [Misgurnus anguillicaudatus]|uniref:uncharacterized protein n=1 Tax=Misgurnus anguillicaudatus TaxID=75329 RepID=UPI0024358B26|nr:uncharacterized protein LOC129453512 isoform X5 [Misgurnus anguillicaudatus]